MDRIIIFTEKTMKDGFSGERAIVLPHTILQMIGKDHLMSQLYITDIGYYPDAHGHYRSRETPIDQYIFIWCISGKGKYGIDGQTFEVSENQYFILPKGKAHWYGADISSPWSIYWLHFKGDLAGYYADSSPATKMIYPGSDSRISDRIELFEEMFNTLNSGYDIDSLRYTSSLLHHFLGTVAYMGEYRKASKNGQKHSSISELITHYMKENIEKDLTLEELASVSGFSVSHFSMTFRKETGHSPLTYFNLLKIRKACMLLDSTDMKMNQICHKIGISDPYYFSRMFSKVMGISPSAYRKSFKG